MVLNTRMSPYIIPLFCTIVILSSLCQNEICTALRVQTNPATFYPYFTDVLNITCIPDDPNYWAISVSTLEFKKNEEETIAVLQQAQLTTGSGIKSNMKTEGRIKKDASQSFLRLTINQPRAEDAGTYKCIMFYLDELFNMKEETASANVIVETHDLAPTVASLVEKMSGLETLVQTQENVISEQGKQLKLQQDYISQQNLKASEMNKTLHVQDLTISNMKTQLKVQQDNQKTFVNGLNGKMGSLEKELQKQETRNANQQKHIDAQGKELDNQENAIKAQLETITGLRNDISNQAKQLQKQNQYIKGQLEQASFKSEFRAAYDPKDKLKVGETVKFRTRLFAIGDAYNFNTGVYTAPKTGTYFFTLSLMTSQTGWINIHIRSNGNSIAKVHCETQQYWDQSSVSSMVALKAGDQVTLFVEARLRVDTFVNGMDTQFSGYLLK